MDDFKDVRAYKNTIFYYILFVATIGKKRNPWEFPFHCFAQAGYLRNAMIPLCFIGAPESVDVQLFFGQLLSSLA